LLTLLALLALLAWAPAHAAPAEALEDGGRHPVVEIVDGDTLVLEGGLQVRLVGIQAPKLPLDRPGFKKWPLADEAKAALDALTRGRTVGLKYGGRRRDRHGRALAHLFTEDGRWIQGALLAQGMARVYSFRDNRRMVAEMLALERQARAANRGIWGHPYYRVLRATETPQFIDSFQLVEARVHRVAVVRGRLYINFAEDWRRDFTVSFRSRDRASLDRAGFDYHALEGRRVRVRGWLKNWNGPMIEATHREQIEVLSE
jgi:endonuclease YncB( thermonuclease family)